jgi:hypothetical protein
MSLWLSQRQGTAENVQSNSAKTTIYLIMPDDSLIYDTFDSSQLIFSIFPLVYSRIDENK